MSSVLGVVPALSLESSGGLDPDALEEPGSLGGGSLSSLDASDDVMSCVGEELALCRGFRGGFPVGTEASASRFSLANRHSPGLSFQCPLARSLIPRWHDGQS